MRPWLVGASLTSALAPGACDNSQALRAPEPGWERMLDQPRYDPYGASPFFTDGRMMRVPSEGTIPHDAIAGQPRVTLGIVAGHYVPTIPVPVTRELLVKGRGSYETFCAACHGVLGDGVSAVAQAMQLRPPPSLHESRIRMFAPGQLYETIRQGYGLMPAYESQLRTEDRWAVVAYVQALQLAEYARVDDLPPAVQHELERVGP